MWCDRKWTLTGESIQNTRGWPNSMRVLSERRDAGAPSKASGLRDDVPTMIPE